MLDLIIARFNYWIYIVLMMIGMYAMIAKKNYVKKLIGMSIFQTAIMLFYVSIGAKKGSTIPILEHGHGPDHGAAGHAAQAAGHAAEAAGQAAAHAAAVNPDGFANPLPHVLMLTAIVVGVATLGVGMAVVQKVYDQYGSIEEDEVLKRVRL